jgi:hypothetical protein
MIIRFRSPGVISTILVGAMLLLVYQIACADSLQGVVVNESGKGIPGLTVSLAHPVGGRSSPSITDSSGHYSFSDVPHRDDAYYLEVRWGKDLLYRTNMVIRGNMTAPQIQLNH